MPDELAGIPVDHRAFAPPGRRWTGRFTWTDLLFAHWPVPAESPQRHLPPRLKIHEFEGSAWLAIVPFVMTNMRLRGLPPLPGLRSTLEANVRTYVTCDGHPGVYFFSLDAASLPAVMGARALYHLRYFHARMSLERRQERIHYTSSRIHAGGGEAELEGWYAPAGESYIAEPGSLEHWLTERYTLFAADKRGRIYRGDIHHGPWPLRKAEARFHRNTMTAQLGLALPDCRPLLHFAGGIDVLVWSARRI